jgi:hypothetical protein
VTMSDRAKAWLLAEVNRLLAAGDLIVEVVFPPFPYTDLIAYNSSRQEPPPNIGLREPTSEERQRGVWMVQRRERS